jgi:hypothetical protein
MANYGYGDLSGMFGDRYSTQATLNDAMLREAHSMGQLSSYGMGQANTFYQAAGGGTPMGSMLTQASPMMQRQNLLDELQKKHPNPDTPEKLIALSSDLSSNGFGDMAMKVREAAMQLQQVETSKSLTAIELTTPNKDLLDQISFGLTSSVLSDEFLESYLNYNLPTQTVDGKEEKVPWIIGSKSSGAWVGGANITQEQYDKRKSNAKTELENQFKAFRNAISRDKTMTIGEINNLLSNETLLIAEFKKWSKTRGSNRMTTFLDNNVRVSDPSGGTTSTGEPIDSSLEDTEQVTTALTASAEDLEAAQLQAQEILNNKPDEHEKIFKELQAIIDASYFKGEGRIERALNLTQQIMYYNLQEKYGDKAVMNSSAFSNPDSQMWFEEMLSDVGGQVV